MILSNKPRKLSLFTFLCEARAAGLPPDMSGYEIPVNAAKEDEGVWLEKRTHNGYERVTVYTRCGHGDGYRVVRVSRKVRAL